MIFLSFGLRSYWVTNAINIHKNKTTDNFFIVFENSIFCLMKAGPITELNNVPGKEPTEKHAKNIPARLLSKI